MKDQTTHSTAVPAIDPAALTQIPPLDVVGMLRVLWYGKWVVAMTTALMLLCGGYYAFHMTQAQFAATATLQVDAQATHLGDVSRHLPTPATDAASLNTEVTILTSDQILTDVITVLDLNTDPEFNRYLTPASPYALNSLRKRLREVLSGSTDAPPNAQAIAQKTVENLRGRVSAVRPDDTYIFQITAKSRDPAKAMRIANAVADAYITAQIAAQDAATHEAIAWLGGRVASLRAQLEQQETQVTTLIAAVQIQEDAALDTLSNAVLAVDEERASLLASLSQAAARANTSTRAAAEAAQLRNQIAEVDAKRGRLQRQLETQSTGMIALQQRQREAAATSVLYQSFLARLQETRVQRGLAYPDSRILAPATSARYAGPRKVFILKASALLGMLFGVFLVTLRHLSRQGAMHPQELRQQTGKAVLAQMTPRLGGRIARLLGKKQPSDAGLCQRINAGLMVASGGVRPQVILVTSTTKGEDSAPLALGLAWAADAHGERILHVAADPASQAAGMAFAGLPTKETLAQWRSAYDQIIVHAAPVFDAPEVALWAGHADAIVYAVRWAKTPIAAVLHGLDRLQEAGTAPIGLVLTKTNPRKMRRFAVLSGSPVARLAVA